jgi:hypothetical protein
MIIENRVCAFTPFIELTHRQMVSRGDCNGLNLAAPISINAACPSSRSDGHCADVRNENIYPNRHVLLKIAVEAKLPLPPKSWGRQAGGSIPRQLESNIPGFFLPAVFPRLEKGPPWIEFQSDKSVAWFRRYR